MTGQLLHVDDPQARRRQHALRRQQAQVRVVLVVDRVVLVSLDEPQEVRYLDAHVPLVGNERSQPVGEVDDVRHVGEHVVGHDEIGPAVLGGHLLPHPLPEKHDLGRDALREGHVGDVPRRLDTEGADAAGERVLEEVAIVAGDLDDEGLRPEVQPLDGLRDEALGVRHPGVTEGGEVGVVGEDVLSRDVRRQLHQQTLVADADVKGVEDLAGVELVSREVALARW